MWLSFDEIDLFAHTLIVCARKIVKVEKDKKLNLFDNDNVFLR